MLKHNIRIIEQYKKKKLDGKIEKLKL